MGRTDVDDVRIAPDTVIQRMEVDSDLAFVKQTLQLSHSDSIILGVVEREVANLKKGLPNEQVVVRRTYIERNSSPIK